MYSTIPQPFRLALAFLLTLPVNPAGRAADTAFTYQGTLTADNQPASGTFDLTFTLHAAPEGPAQLGIAVTNLAIAVQSGLLNVDLDFGPDPFNGTPLWLEIGLRPAGSADPFAILTPRQRLAPAPNAIHALTAQSAALADLATTVPPQSVTAAHIAPQTLTGQEIANGQIVRSLNGLHDDVQISAGENIALTTQGHTLTLSAAQAWNLTGNANTLPPKNFIGTTDAQPLELKVQGNRALRLEPTPFATVINVIGGSSGNFVRPGTTGATIAGGGAVYPEGSGDFTNAVHAEFGTIGGGSANWIGTNASHAAIGGGHLNSIERGASEALIAGGMQNRIESNAFRAFIGGGYLHTVNPGAYAAVITGGISNSVATYYSTISGGSRNHIGQNSAYATIGGGGDNLIASGSFSGTIGGGGENQILDNSQRSTIAGGKLNQIGANSPHSTIGGGLSNRVAPHAQLATIPGGSSNLVDATLSLAAGHRAQALHPGSFIWADSSPADFTTTHANEFSVRATGGARFVSALDGIGVPLAGVTLEPGAGSWSTLSDRNAKANLAPVDSPAILEQLAKLPIHTWNYRSQPADARHLGPTAQDFHAAFGLGTDSRHIATVDADGVALAAIQGLHQLLQEKSARIAALESHNAQLERRLHLLEQRLAEAPTAKTDTSFPR